MQGIPARRDREELASLLPALPTSELVGFRIADRSAANYRLLRSRGVPVRKTIDGIIPTFCVENGHQLTHFDRDIDHMPGHIGLDVI